jgi:steroid 5-alpha reductase family enzyme
MLSLLAWVLAAMTAVMLAAWGFALRTKNGGWTDVFWSFGTGLVLAGAAIVPLPGAAAPGVRQWLVAGLVLAWSLRLGSYIAARVASGHEDARYAQFRRDWGRDYARNMLWVALPQAPASALLAVSVLTAAHRPGPLDVRDLAAAAVLGLAIAGEALADAQMRRFRADPANRGQVCDRGLWAWSRHPNYFFEWLGWFGYPVMALNLGAPATWLTLVAPVVMFVLLTRVSGVPPLEQAMLRSRGPAYRAYQARVSAFFPLPPKGTSR